MLTYADVCCVLEVHSKFTNVIIRDTSIFSFLTYAENTQNPTLILHIPQTPHNATNTTRALNYLPHVSQHFLNTQEQCSELTIACVARLLKCVARLPKRTHTILPPAGSRH